MKLIPVSATRSVAISMLKMKKASPHIFFVGGVVGVVGATVLACKSTLKLEKTIDEIKEDIVETKHIHEIKSDTALEYDERSYYKDLGRVYVRSTVKLGRLYGPSIILGTASVAALTGSHVQMTRRNAALGTTLAAVSKAYDEYRLRMQEELGEQKERDIYQGVTTETKGNKKIAVFNPTGFSVYARIFDETCQSWTKDVERNRMFLKCQQTYANHKLQAHGYLLLNDVYDMLGFERSSAGCVVGWVRDGDGDGFVDFGLFDAAATRFINGLENAVWLDFNVDGVVYELIGD